jgi:hypothetical protein
LDAEPAEPEPAELAAIRDHLIEIITTGSPEELQALCEATIARAPHHRTHHHHTGLPDTAHHRYKQLSANRAAAG